MSTYNCFGPSARSTVEKGTGESSSRQEGVATRGEKSANQVGAIPLFIWNEKSIPIHIADARVTVLENTLSEIYLDLSSAIAHDVVDVLVGVRVALQDAREDVITYNIDMSIGGSNLRQISRNGLLFKVGKRYPSPIAGVEVSILYTETRNHEAYGEGSGEILKALDQRREMERDRLRSALAVIESNYGKPDSTVKFQSFLKDLIDKGECGQAIDVLAGSFSGGDVNRVREKIKSILGH